MNAVLADQVNITLILLQHGANVQDQNDVSDYLVMYRVKERETIYRGCLTVSVILRKNPRCSEFI